MSSEIKSRSETPTSAVRWAADVGPYLVMIGIGAVLYYFASHITYQAISGQMGPERWPKIVVGLFIAVCAYEAIRRIIVAARGVPVKQNDESDDGFSQQMEAHPVLVAWAAGATVAYLLALDFVGFFTATVIYCASIMWLGGVRRPLFVSVAAVIMGFFFSFFFLNLIYVALPLGQGPFMKVSLIVMKLVGAN